MIKMLFIKYYLSLPIIYSILYLSYPNQLLSSYSKVNTGANYLKTSLSILNIYI